VALQVGQAQRVVGRWGKSVALQVGQAQVVGRWVELWVLQVVAQASCTPMASDSTWAGQERVGLVAGCTQTGLAQLAPLEWQGPWGLRRWYLAQQVERSL